jgi:hypothetical protein
MSDQHANDVSMLLVGPGGQAVVLMSDAVSSMANVTFTLSDQAYYPLPSFSPLLNGTFQPTDYAPNHTDPPWAFPGPAPAPPFGTTLGTFNGLSPNGTWSLYVYDGGGDNGGQISGGWSLAIGTPPPPTKVTITSIQLVKVSRALHARLTGIGNPGVVYTIQASTNFSGWQAIGTVTAGTNGTFSLDDSKAGSFGKRLYRVLLP